MSEQNPVAYRQHIEVTRNGVTTKEFSYYDIQIMQGDEALFTADQLKAEREKAIRECAEIARLGMEYNTLGFVYNEILALLSTDESKENA
jgi:hypothetical protein